VTVASNTTRGLFKNRLGQRFTESYFVTARRIQSTTAKGVHDGQASARSWCLTTIQASALYTAYKPAYH
jgi:hypothetical protein